MNSAVEPRPFWPAFFAALTARRVAWAVGLAFAVALLLSPAFKPSLLTVFGRTLFVALVVLLAFTAAGQWRRAPLPRWGAQLLAIVLFTPLATVVAYAFSTGFDLRLMLGMERLSGMALIGFVGVTMGVIFALGAMVREREAQAREQALAFALERATLERQAADARLALLQQQIEPHFLFNTLANVQALVEGGSPRAATVLASLIAWLRAAMPQLHEGAPTLGREATLVRAYLELMQMRMPDRLSYSIAIDAALHAFELPPMTLITLVENAVRHGIDPSEHGGHIEVGARREGDGALQLWVADSGRGIDETHPPGTGLANLRERLAATFGARATLTLTAVAPQGLRAEIRIAPEAAPGGPTQ